MTVSLIESEWSEKRGSKGTWTRNLVGGEQFCYRAAIRSGETFGRESVSLTAHVQLASTMTEDSLVGSIRMAWLQTRHDYPDIATTADENGNKTYQSLQNEEETTKWLNETFIVAKEKLVEDIRHEANPTPYALLYWFPGTSQLALYSSHWRIDGSGCIQLLGHVLSLMVQPSVNGTYELGLGKEVSKLSPDFFRASGTSFEERLFVQEQGRQMNKALEEADIDESFTLPTIPDLDGRKPSGHLQVRMQFSVEESDRIFSSCRRKGLSVTVGIHTAFVLALLMMNKKNNGEPAHGRPPTYSSAGRISFRQFLPYPYSSSKYAASVYTAAGAMSIPVTNFADTAAQFASSYRSLLTRARNGEAPAMFAMFTFLAENPAGLTLFMALPYITSLGNLDSMLSTEYESANGSQQLRLTDFGFSVTQLGKGVAGMLWTFGGKLTLEIGFNEAFYATETISAFLKEVKLITLVELC